MKLIYLSHWRFPSEKTMSPLIMKTCENFAKQGFEVELWVPRRFNFMKKKDPFQYHEVQHNFEIKYLMAIDGTVLKWGFGFLIMVFTYAFNVFVRSYFTKDYKDAVFYAHDARDTIFLSLIARNLFIEAHDFYLSRFSFLNLPFKKARGLIVTNKIKMKALMETYDIQYNRMIHKPNAVDPEKFNIDSTKEVARNLLGLPQDQKIILYAGHLFSWKGVDTLLASHEFLKENQHIYFIGGSEEDIESFRTKLVKSGAKNVSVVGNKLHSEVPLWYKAADVLVLPNTAKEEASKNETSPVKLFEYMASGVPIVASDLPSIRNVVNESMVWFFKPDDAGSLAATIHDALEYKEESQNKSLVAKNDVKQYTWSSRIGDISHFIRKIILKNE